jgi:hypothetical protein
MSNQLVAALEAGSALRLAEVNPDRFIPDSYTYEISYGRHFAATGWVRVAEPDEGDEVGRSGCVRALSVSSIPEGERWVWLSGHPDLLPVNQPLPGDNVQDKWGRWGCGKWCEVEALFVAGLRVV